MQLPQQFGPYLLEELIARGGMAEVYRASMAGAGAFQKTVAIKKILPHLAADEDFVSMLIGEAQIIVNINHANIAQVLDLGKIEDTYYIAMEFIQGVDLADILKDLEAQNARLPIEHALWVARCILSGLNHAHNATDRTGRPLNIVHRDISPHNVLVSFGGDVKIIDFGVAKARGMEHTKEGVIKGKLLYMAPEQAMAEQVDSRADIFAVGVIMYRMLTGQLPFQGDNEFQIYNNIVSRDISSPTVINSGIGPEVDRIVMRLLERDPSRRYQDGYSASIDIDHALQSVSPGYSASRFSRYIEDNFSHLMRRRLLDSGMNEFGIPQTPVPLTHQTHERPALEDSDRERVREMEPQSGIQQGPVMNPQTSGKSDWRTQNPGLAQTGPIQPPKPQQIETGKKASALMPIALTLFFWIVTAGLIAYEVQFRSQPADATPVPAQNPVIEKRAEPTPEKVAPVPVENAERVTVEINSTPAAILTIDGEEVGETPFSVQTPQGDTPISVKLELAGYVTQSFDIIPSEDIKKVVKLESENAPENEEAEKPEAAPKKTTPQKAPKKTVKKPKTKPKAKPKPKSTIPILDEPMEKKPAKKKPAKKKPAEKEDKLNIFEL